MQKFQEQEQQRIQLQQQIDNQRALMRMDHPGEYCSVLYCTPYKLVCGLGLGIFRPLFITHQGTGQVGLGVGSWHNNRTNAGSPPIEFDYTS